MKRTVKKLELRSEAVRTLGTADLRGIVGGKFYPTDPTDTCSDYTCGCGTSLGGPSARPRVTCSGCPPQ